MAEEVRYTPFGRKLQQLLAEKGLDTKELAKKSGLGERTIKRWMTGESKQPQAANIKLINETLGLTTEQAEQLRASLDEPATAEPDGRDLAEAWEELDRVGAEIEELHKMLSHGLDTRLKTSVAEAVDDVLGRIRIHQIAATGILANRVREEQEAAERAQRMALPALPPRRQAAKTALWRWTLPLALVLAVAAVSAYVVKDRVDRPAPSACPTEQFDPQQVFGCTGGSSWLTFFGKNQDLLGVPLGGMVRYDKYRQCVYFTYFITCRSEEEADEGSSREFKLIPLGEILLGPDPRTPDASLSQASQKFVDRQREKDRDWHYWLGWPVTAEICQGNLCYQVFENQKLVYPKDTRDAYEVKLSPFGESLKPR
jgi:transcriptional regulator with XRE-family HTH domain